MPKGRYYIRGRSDWNHGITRPGFFGRKSDIDIFVVVKERRPDTDQIWWHRIDEVLRRFRRGVTVITYSVAGLKNISNWYVLRLASEGIIVYDQGNIKNLLDKIIKAARSAGLIEKEIGGQRVWTAPYLKLGGRFTLKVKEDG